MCEGGGVEARRDRQGPNVREFTLLDHLKILQGFYTLRPSLAIENGHLYKTSYWVLLP